MSDYKRIYLQVKDEYENDIDVTSGELTWCGDRINDTDIEYVRADLYATLRAQNERCKAALEKIAGSPMLSAGEMVDGTYTNTFDVRDIAREALDSLKRGEG